LDEEMLLSLSVAVKIDDLRANIAKLLIEGEVGGGKLVGNYGLALRLALNGKRGSVPREQRRTGQNSQSRAGADCSHEATLPKDVARGERSATRKHFFFPGITHEPYGVSLLQIKRIVYSSVMPSAPSCHEEQVRVFDLALEPLGGDDPVRSKDDQEN